MERGRLFWITSANILKNPSSAFGEKRSQQRSGRSWHRGGAEGTILRFSMGMTTGYRRISCKNSQLSWTVISIAPFASTTLEFAIRRMRKKIGIGPRRVIRK